MRRPGDGVGIASRNESTARYVTPTDADGWRDRAACLGLHPDVFFDADSPTKKGAAALEKARLACGSCPVRLDCLEYALAAREEWGVWGGFTAEERKRIIKGQPVAFAYPAPDLEGDAA